MKRFFIIAAALTVSALRVHATDYYVATNGNDGGTGSRDEPFATLQRAADAMQQGDTCWISSGTYRETVTLKGKNNLTFQALPGEVVTLSGTDPLAGEWRNFKKNIYEIEVAKPVSQVFVDGAPMTYARWPNANFQARWSPSFWKANNSPYGSVTDPDLAKSGIDWTGAILTLNTRPTWNKYTAIVKSHKENDDTLQYVHDKLWSFPGGKHHGYFLCGKLEALDAPEEWYYDRQAGKFYLCFPGGAEPKGHSVEVKVRDYGFIAEQSDHVTLKGLHFFATTFLFRECDNTLVDGCHICFPNVAYLLTELDRNSKPTVSTTLIGHHNTVRNSSVAYSPTHGLRMLGSHALVENNLIYDCNQIGSLAYAPLWMGNLEDNVTWEGALKYEGRLKESVTGSVVGSTETVRAKTGDEPDRAQPAGKCVIRNNTLFKSGNIVLAFYEQPDYSVTYNHVYDGGCFVHDVSLIYTTLPQIRGSVIAYNWVHGCPNLAIRGDDQSRGITYHHNVTWDGKGGHIIVKGEDNAVYNNTTLTGTAENRGLNIQTMPEPNKPHYRKLWPLLKEQNARTPVANNLACTITDTRSFKEMKVAFPPTDRRMANNMVTLDIKSLLQDPDNFDFRPKAGSPLIDAGRAIPGITDGFVGKAPDIGAYEFGGPLWKPGHQNTLRVSEPDADGAIRVALAMPPTDTVSVSITAEHKETVFASIRFHEKNWMIPQQVVLPGNGRYLITAESKEIKPIPQKTIQVKESRR